MVRGDLVKLFLTLETKSLVRSTAKAFGVNSQSDAQTEWHTNTLYAVASGFFLRLRETRASGPGAGREVDLEEGDAEVYSGKRHRSRSNSALPAFALLRPAGRLFPCPSGGATEQPQHQSSPRRLIKRTAERQVWR